MSPLLFEQTLHIITAIGAILILLLVIYLRAKTKREKYELARVLIEQSAEKATSELLEKAGLSVQPRHIRDVRKGSMFAIIGITMTIVFANMGGVGWMFGSVPITIGLVYIFFGYLSWPRS